MAVIGAILPKIYANTITRDEQKKKIVSYAKFVGNKQKQTKERFFFISNVVSIVSSPSKKIIQNQVHTIKDILQCSRSSTYR